MSPNLTSEQHTFENPPHAGYPEGFSPLGYAFVSYTSRMRLTFLLALLPTLALAQSQPAPRPEDLGTVTGHITCADTQRPARFAAVSLIAARVTGDSPESLSPFNPAAIGPVHTDLTGAYTITNVPPGQYYLRVIFTVTPHHSPNSPLPNSRRPPAGSRNESSASFNSST